METVGTESARSGFSEKPTLGLIQQSPCGYVTEGLLPSQTFLSVRLLLALSPTEISWLLRTLGLHLILSGVRKAEMGLVRQDRISSRCSPGAVPQSSLSWACGQDICALANTSPSAIFPSFSLYFSVFNWHHHPSTCHHLTGQKTPSLTSPEDSRCLFWA